MASTDCFDWETLGYVARKSSSSESLVRKYADLGLITSYRDSNSHRVFPAGTAERVRQLKAERTRRIQIVGRNS